MLNGNHVTQKMPAKAKPVVLSQVGYSIGVLSILHATPNHGM